MDAMAVEKPREVWYRIVDYWSGAGYTDESGDYHSAGGRQEVEMLELPVIKHTPCGVWLATGPSWRRDGGKRWVSRFWNKQYACPYKDQALVSFLARKSRQSSILMSKLAAVDEAIENARKKWSDL